jgi:hypothetical protein
MSMPPERHLQLLDEFMRCLDEERYYDAHEALEKIWFPRRFENDDEMKLLKGFINASVAFELVKRGRHESSKRVWDNYLKYRPLLQCVDSPHFGRYRVIAEKIESIRSTHE